MTFTKLVIAGSTGYLADVVLPAILNSTKPKFDVKILTRANSSKLPSLVGAKILPVDYDDHQSLVRAVRGADAIISLISGVASKTVDLNLLKAGQEAGVRRIFPSEYTLDVLHPDAVSLLTEGGSWPESSSAVLAARKFTALADEGGPTSFTTLIPAAFMDSWLEGEFGLFDPKNHEVTLIDGGNHYFSGCTLPFLASALIAVLGMDEEKTKNKRVHIAEVRCTMNDVANIFEEITGAKFERVPVAIQTLYEQRNKALQNGNFLPALFTSIHIGAFGGGGSGDLKDGLQFDGDGHFNVKRKSLTEVAAAAVAKVASS